MEELLGAKQLGDDQTAVKKSVQNYYGEELKDQNDLKTSACKTCIPPPKEIRQYLKEVPKEVLVKFYGCGTPLPLGITGLRVLDLGSGSGRDCYVASRLVGENGSVTGIDMTPSQLEVANRHLEAYTRDVLKYSKPNMRFIQGEIEYLDKAGIPDESQDLVISNCVINLSPDKARVLQQVYRVLAPGGEMYFSDVYCDRRLPYELRTHPVLLGECLGGALYINDFIRLCHQVGFTDPRRLSIEPISVDDPELKEVVGEARFYSITYRLFKVPGRLETLCEDYGQVAVYKGTIPGHRHAYDLDDHHRFVANKPMLVCGNTASMVAENGWPPTSQFQGTAMSTTASLTAVGLPPARLRHPDLQLTVLEGPAAELTAPGLGKEPPTTACMVLKSDDAVLEQGLNKVPKLLSKEFFQQKLYGWC
eukprot:CAMPEP_0202901272 /NCGR_PEP_ID=MMETSP1392-20130828/14163_1 /ASSEMBLY_ACC=CAM_ASM_000868 /TAXON_ID=225041 /ORGANISM="Chlamydomonas chlamydogama, Strain SAG 11-48b" /LENGTH=419 /DNA_ID=CAMNT_0049587817 /DNA_START=214 /DNA_END=1475 /DNA_ORIENTATION=+